MYDILIRKIYNSNLSLLQTLDTAWLLIHVDALKMTQETQDNSLLSLANHLHLKAVILMDNFISEGKSDAARIHCAIHANLTLSSYLTQLTDLLKEHPLLQAQHSFLQKARDDNERQLRTLIESSRDEYTQSALKSINFSTYERTSRVNGYFAAQIFTERAQVEAFKKEIVAQAKTARDEIDLTLAYWKTEINAAIAGWRPAPASLNRKPPEAYSTSPTDHQSSSASSTAPRRTPAVAPYSPPPDSAANRLQLRLKEITGAYTKDHPILLNQEQTLDQITRLLSHNPLDLGEKQEDELLAKISDCICIRYQHSRFVTKRLPALHLDEAALGQVINSYKQQVSKAVNCPKI